MSRILLATLGSLGDLHPCIAVARALRARGHQAVVAAAPEYREPVEAAGVGFAPVRPSLDALGDRAAVARRLFHPVLGPRRLLREVVLPHLHESFADLDHAAASADLLVSHPLTFTVPIVAERRGLPWVSTVLAPLSLMSRHDPPRLHGGDLLRRAARIGPRARDAAFALARATARHWEAPLQSFRQELGLPRTAAPMLFEGQFSPQGTLALFDAPLAAPQADWPPALRVCGAALHDGAAPDAAALPELERFLAAGDPPLVFALGSSAVWFADGFWAAAAQAAHALGRRAVLVTGSGLPRELPPGVRAFDYLPYSAVFPRAAAVVHQCGIGTLAQALRAGRPQLLVPVAFDQPDNAARACRLGVGRELPFRRVDARRLEAALAALLDDPRHAQAAERCAAELRDSEGAGAAADALLEVLARRAAVVDVSP
jgi:UDP:flavonoid glycosyltransferase YjiC (YdhE family)